MKIFKRIMLLIFLLFIVGVGTALWIWKGSKTSNPNNYATIGDIPTPVGYERINCSDGIAQYLRSLPLQERGHMVQLYTGGDARFQSLNYATVNMHLLSNDEQCADMCMRLRAEYLRWVGRDISFRSVSGRNLTFCGGSRRAFESYLRKVYGVASTLSLSRSLQTRELQDIQPGDVFVYAGVDRGQTMGHAVIVVDVAQNSNGDKVFMIAEGNTPARECHVVRNFLNPFRSPWFTLDKDANYVQLSPFTYKAKELKFWN